MFEALGKRMTRVRRGIVAVLLALVAVLAGCAKQHDISGQVAAMNDSNIRRVANLYRAYQVRYGMKGPRDETAFKQFIQKEMSPAKLEMMQVDPNKIDELFISERDGQPFHLRYGIVGGFDWVVAVAFEQTGQEGKRLVAFTGGAIEEATEDRYLALLEDKGRSLLAQGPNFHANPREEN